MYELVLRLQRGSHCDLRARHYVARKVGQREEIIQGLPHRVHALWEVNFDLESSTAFKSSEGSFCDAAAFKMFLFWLHLT